MSARVLPVSLFALSLFSNLLLFQTCLYAEDEMSLQSAAEAGEPCEGFVCSSEQRCVKHLVTDCDGLHCSATRWEGRCVDKGLSRGDQQQFSCGTHVCGQSFFQTMHVCCITRQAGSLVPQYRCAATIYNCPGNQDRLPIRQTALDPTTSNS